MVNYVLIFEMVTKQAKVKRKNQGRHQVFKEVLYHLYVFEVTFLGPEKSTKWHQRIIKTTMSHYWAFIMKLELSFKFSLPHSIC